MSHRPALTRRQWGTDEDGCSVLHVDMDAFFASVELTRRPELRGRPVIVGGSGRSVVLAATYEARAFGIHSAMPMAQALRRCPHAVVVPPDQGAYRAASRAAMQVLRDVTPVVEQVSVDEAFLDVSGARRRLGPPTAVAEHVRRGVHERVGVTCSVGIASTKFVAKLASGFAKPDGVLLVPKAATVEFLHSLPVEALWGVGERTRAALARWGISTVAELANTDRLVLQRAVGKSAGAHLHDLAWGRDPRPVTPERVDKSVGAETTLEKDTADRDVLRTLLLGLADRTAAELRRRRVVARTVSLKLRTADFATLTRARTLPTSTDTARELHRVVCELLDAVELAGPVRLVGVRAEGLGPAQDRALTLEEAVDDGSAVRRAETALDEVRARFGSGSITSATLLEPGRITPSARSTTVRGAVDLS